MFDLGILDDSTNSPTPRKTKWSSRFRHQTISALASPFLPISSTSLRVTKGFCITTFVDVDRLAHRESGSFSVVPLIVMSGIGGAGVSGLNLTA